MITKAQIKELDSLAFRQFCKEPHRCFLCSNPAIEEHHLFRRDYKIIRWNKFNRIPICRFCHREIHDTNDERLVKLYISKYGQEQYDELKRLSLLVKPPLYFDEIKKEIEGD